jgi:hypothetical protein
MDPGQSFTTRELKVAPHQEVQNGTGLLPNSRQSAVTAAQQFVAQSSAQRGIACGNTVLCQLTDTASDHAQEVKTAL